MTSRFTSSAIGRTFLALGSKPDALAAAKALSEGADALKYVFSVQLNPALWHSAHAVGAARTAIKVMRGKAVHEQRAGQDERIDTEGALGELVMALLLEKAGANAAPLVAFKPDTSGLDIELEGRWLDVKSVGEGRAMLNINARAHASKPPAAYVVVKFARSDVADVFVVNGPAAGAWPITDFLYGKPLDPRRFYHSARLPWLPPLPEVEEPCEA